MKSEIIVRQLNENETAEALSLVWNVFLEYEAPDYSEEGIEEFRKSIHDEKYLSQLRMFGAFKDEKAVGVIATRNGGTHIALFFVDGKYHRQGIGKELFKTVCRECNADRITVNSSPFAVTIYQKLGFCKTDKEQTVNGLRFTPMEYKEI
ncbi:MAG: GNAT family N-acetyltransferase [Acutalibacteraceae bacterium]